jgi:hypothetical protein
VRERLALDVALDAADLVETLEVPDRRPKRVLARAGEEVAAVHVLVFHGDHERHRHHAVAPGLEFEESGHDMCALDDHAHAFDRCSLEQRVHTDSDRRHLFAEPHDDRVARGRFAEGSSRLERRRVQGRHQLV